MTFIDCLHQVWDDEVLMAGYRRLSGSNIGLDSRHPIEKMVDAATGYEPVPATPGEVEHFLNFVWECVWLRLPERGE